MEMKKLEEMKKEEFFEIYRNAEDGDLLTPGIKKCWSPDNGGYWYLACTADTNDGEINALQYLLEPDDDNYCSILDVFV